MKTIILALVGVTALTSLTACYSRPPVRTVTTTTYTTGGPGPVVYDAYYNNYYGPYTSGYWNRDGYFYYRDSSNTYRRDDARHFRRDPYNGGVGVRVDGTIGAMN